MRALFFLLIPITVLTACSGPAPDFSDRFALEGNGPDASNVVLNDPLVLPPTNALPEPTPGGTSRANPG